MLNEKQGNYTYILEIAGRDSKNKYFDITEEFGNYDKALEKLQKGVSKNKNNFYDNNNKMIDVISITAYPDSENNDAVIYLFKDHKNVINNKPEITRNKL